ncbi:MAG: PfkB family carbohydrate kinase, partial [bacterium]|nr:PfkB family carbohydrate kinase [bacterium]
TLYFRNIEMKTRPFRIIKSTDTIGAGDTFFAFFITAFLRSNDTRKSLKYATDKTSTFLLSKNNLTQPSARL